MHTSKETISGRVKPEPILTTTLMGIASKAKREKEYRFEDLIRQINYNALRETWGKINKKSSPGVDKVTAKKFAENLDENINKIVDDLKRNGYRPSLVRRVYIDKENGKKRPLGIPVIVDKLLQSTVSRILEAIYEQDFYDFSHGYRPHKSVHTARRELSNELQYNSKYKWFIEADIKGFFDNIKHEKLIEFLEHRINDKRFIRLIKKWLRAGILEPDKQIINPKSGTPQGGSVSPILANIYLHYVLDNWFMTKIKPKCNGKAYLCRYADDFVVAFENEKEAVEFMKVLHMRFNVFGLELSAEKTNLIKFTRWEKGTSFDFLGFEYRWKISRNKKNSLHKRTSRAKLRKSLKNFSQWIKENRHMRLRNIFKELNTKLQGYYNHYGIRGNSKSLEEFHYHVRRILYKWLNRRSQRKSFNWDTFTNATKYYNMVTPKIFEKDDKQIKLDLSFV